MADTDFDILIIGGGPGGYVAAVRAAQLGLRAAVVERAHLGGICLNWGCIPTKALLRSAEVYRYLGDAVRFGLTAERIEFDISALVERSRTVAARLSKGVDGILKKNKVPVIWGEATISAPGKVAVKASDAPSPRGVLGGGEYTAKNIIVATGARPRVLSGLEPDGDRIWTYFQAMAPKVMPKSLIVVGSGAIGAEFASFYRTMGAEVTLVELLPQILPVEDDEVSKLVRKQFEKQGIRVLTSAKVIGIEKAVDGLEATIDLGAGKSVTLAAERMVSAVGVVANTEGIGLEALGVKTERGTIATDGFGHTSVPGIYAIGDVAGPPLLAHKAEHEGILCVEAIAGLNPRPLDRAKIPGCTYCFPQVASVGLTEAKARESGREIKVGNFPFVGNGKAMALGEPEGFVKTVFDARSGRLLGAHLVGAEVTELIQGFVIAMNLETTEEELIHAIFPHPTLSEAMHESVLSAYGRVIHI